MKIRKKLTKNKNKKLIIGIVSEYFPPDIVGGAERSAYELARALVEQGQEVHVFTSSSKKEDIHEKYDNINVHRLNSLNFMLNNKKRSIMFYLLNDGIYHLKCVPSLYKYAKKYNIQIIHSMNLYSTFSSLFTSFLLNIPSVSTLRDYWPYCIHRDFLKTPDKPCNGCNLKNFTLCSKRLGIRRQSLSTIIYPFVRLFIKFRFAMFLLNIKIIGKSNFEKDFLIKHGAKTSKVAMIPNIACVNSSIKEYSESKENNILVTARLCYQKGQHLLIKAMPKILKKVKNAKLLIVGNGPQEEYFKNLVRKLNLKDNVKFLGFKNKKQLALLIKKSKLVTVLHYMPESYSRSAVEAMGNMKPYLGLNQGAQKEMNKIYNNKEIICLADYNVDSISEKLILLLENKELRKKIAVNGYNFVKNYISPEIISKKHIEIYSTII